jgi:hypothetical protein
MSREDEDKDQGYAFINHRRPKSPQISKNYAAHNLISDFHSPVSETINFHRLSYSICDTLLKLLKEIKTCTSWKKLFLSEILKSANDRKWVGGTQ